MTRECHVPFCGEPISEIPPDHPARADHNDGPLLLLGPQRWHIVVAREREQTSTGEAGGVGEAGEARETEGRPGTGPRDRRLRLPSGPAGPFCAGWPVC